MTDHAAITAICRYPVKGLSAERLESVPLRMGECIPLDRAYAVEIGRHAFDPTTPRHFQKTKFLQLMSHAPLAALETELCQDSRVLTVRRDGELVLKASLSEAEGRAKAERFFAAHLGGEFMGTPRIVDAPGHSFSDVAPKLISIINLESVRALEAEAGWTIDPLRFRANVYIDGPPAWSEFEWLDRRLAINGMAALKIIDRITRCAATEVAPGSGVRDLSIPRILRTRFGHQDMGLYARVEQDCTLSRGDTLAIAAS